MRKKPGRPKAITAPGRCSAAGRRTLSENIIAGATGVGAMIIMIGLIRASARGIKYRPKPLLPTAHAIECRPTSKRSDKLINITLLGLSLGLRLRQFIITDSRQHRR